MMMQCSDFIEAMKALGYPRSISVESFRTPNFEMTADALYFLVKRYATSSDLPRPVARSSSSSDPHVPGSYDPAAELSDDISTEDARIEFLKSAATIMVRISACA
jgi:clusterin-associated protein 1